MDLWRRVEKMTMRGVGLHQRLLEQTWKEGKMELPTRLIAIRLPFIIKLESAELHLLNHP